MAVSVIIAVGFNVVTPFPPIVSLLPGVEVPIPTLPALEMRILSDVELLVVV